MSAPGAQATVPETPLPAGWIKQFDENYKAWFYVNTNTNPPTTQWEAPVAEGGADGERGLGKVLGVTAAGATAAVIANKIANKPGQPAYPGAPAPAKPAGLGVGGSIAAGGAAAAGVLLLGHVLKDKPTHAPQKKFGDNDSDDEDRHKYHGQQQQYPPQGYGGPGGYGGGYGPPQGGPYGGGPGGGYGGGGPGYGGGGYGGGGGGPIYGGGGY
ncbi:uncharacterized protein LOC62_04G006116 [Vanrija pseudolonga]|uniref:WW domain-containing protein n=1 Tax=Vanrija pseudolonga TaxID=143232 RepID=A0AAF1BN15_9TREE|nr:hypothetical protein LOC62_04G006116 [Vanrija pseudolonga]